MYGGGKLDIIQLNFMYMQLRSIDRLLDKLQSSASEVKTPSVFCLHTQKLAHRIHMLKLERAQICFERRPESNIDGVSNIDGE